LIAIVNVSKKNSPFGEHKYEVRINREVVATFKHKKEDGLAQCLLRAAKAVEQQRWKREADIIMAKMDNAEHIGLNGWL